MLDLTLRNNKFGIWWKKIEFSGDGIKTIVVRNIKKQEQGVSVGQPILIWAHARIPVAYGIF